jgi:hypothetical protein
MYQANNINGVANKPLVQLYANPPAGTYPANVYFTTQTVNPATGAELPISEPSADPVPGTNFVDPQSRPASRIGGQGHNLQAQYVKAYYRSLADTLPPRGYTL